ncbi:hypothetical protein G6514_006708 [Epicoccum nigrum]|nr:hypothetical protein G6514_006708 [Epicoccum nigrum]
MRLLHYDSEGDLVLTDDLVDEGSLPAYAILSHTWVEEEEVTFQELKAGTGMAKPGYRKIEYCGQQARRDGLRYYWVDTCCIDKTNTAEYRHAVKSMYRWYQSAKVCYVYLADVSTERCEAEKESWQCAFAASRWFTRGWTLQELLAPSNLQFYSSEWTGLGDKASLQLEIHRITAVPLAVLNGALLSDYSVEERLQWGSTRQTKLEEDRVYSMEGFFGIDLAPIYGIGYQEAFRRLQEEIKLLSACVRDLYVTDTRDDKHRIQETKGGLLKDASHWIYNTSEYQEWFKAEQGSILWIKGDPGKGKTMLICSIIDDLQSRKEAADILAYFFCQATDTRINNSTAVLRGLLCSIFEQQPSLTSHLRTRYSRAGGKMFEDSNAWIVLTGVFSKIINDPLLPTTYMLIDALDECDANLKELLRFISLASHATSRVRWVLSSRNWPLIQDGLADTNRKLRLSLELNGESIAAAVRSFIHCKVSQLAAKHGYDAKTQRTIVEYVSVNAEDTFLWVALLFNTLKDVPKRHVLQRLKAMPAGLDALYERMLHQISTGDDVQLCMQILAIIGKVHRPITVHELSTLLTTDLDLSVDELAEVVGLCGAFLTLRDDKLYYIHQSAVEFVIRQAPNLVFPLGISSVDVVWKLETSECLCVLENHASFVDLIFVKNNHQLMSADIDGTINIWDVSSGHCLQRLSCIDPTPLEPSPLPIPNVPEYRLICGEFFGDATQFICATPNSILRHEVETGKTVKLNDEGASYGLWVSSDSTRYAWLEDENLLKVADAHTGVILQKITCQSKQVRSLNFSRDARWLALGGDDGVVTVHDLSVTEVPSTKRDCYFDGPIAWSPNALYLAVANESTVEITDMDSGQDYMLRGHAEKVLCFDFRQSSTMQLGSGSRDGTIKVWDLETYTCTQDLLGHESPVYCLAFCQGQGSLISVSVDATIKIWDLTLGQCVQNLRWMSSITNDMAGCSSAVALSTDATRMAVAFGGNALGIWDLAENAVIYDLRTPNTTSLAFSMDSTKIAIASKEDVVILDIQSKQCLMHVSHDAYMVDRMSFDDTGHFLTTNIGCIDVRATVQDRVGNNVIFRGLSAHEHLPLLHLDSKPLLYIHMDHWAALGPSNMQILNDSVAIRDCNGRLEIYKFDLETLRALRGSSSMRGFTS